MDKLERLATAPMTGSSAEYLTEVYGGAGTTINQFASALPTNARVADIAAGRSNFGSEIAARRTDIIWLYVDRQYADPQKATQLPSPLPDNVHPIASDGLMPGLAPRSFDRVYSSRFVEHLVEIRSDLGKQALRAMLTLLKPDGILTIGPTHRRLSSHGFSRKAVELRADASDEAIEQAAWAMSLSRARRLALGAMNASGVSVFTAKRLDPAGKGRRLFDHRDETYHRLASWRGLQLAGRLALGFAQRHKFEEPA